MSFILLNVSAYKATIRQIYVNNYLQTTELYSVTRISDIPIGVDFSCFEIN
jgi:hypothetical protein